MCIKVSVIVPVYNSEKYLPQCIESLLEQTLEECEFIFVNDGSIDRSEEILWKYEKLDSRIKIISQENKGVSVARNRGIEVATGEYIGFVDSDDWIETDMYEVLFNKADNMDLDVVVCNIEFELDRVKSIIEYPFIKNHLLEKKYIDEVVIPHFLKKENFNTACTKLYKREVIKDNNILFTKNVALGEDYFFNLSFFSRITSLVYIDYCGYHYREALGSATRNIIAKDYFGQALNRYLSDTEERLELDIDNEKIKYLKSIKFIEAVKSNIYMYLQTEAKMSFYERYKYVKSMIRNKYMREALKRCWDEIYLSSNRFEKMMLIMIKLKTVLGLFLITFYSKVRCSRGENNEINDVCT